MARHDNVIGKYVYLTINGIEYRVYYESAGTGIPLVCQHTAGAHGLQWRHLLEDPEITRQYQVIAWDLPFHGKSLGFPAYSFHEDSRFRDAIEGIN